MYRTFFNLFYRSYTPSFSTSLVDSSTQTPCRIYNWRRGILKPEHKFLAFNPRVKPTGKKDLTDEFKFPPIYNQGSLGSCTSNAICSCFTFDVLNHCKDEAGSSFHPSRLYHYYKEREMEDSIKTDSGATIEEGIQVLEKGVCSEESYPYVISHFTEKPPARCDVEAQNHRALQDRRVNQTLDDLRSAIDSGFPVSFGFQVYKSFDELDGDFILPLPKVGEELLGGHAVVIIGYNDEIQVFKIRNSWGAQWGKDGYFFMKYEFIINPEYCADFWVVSKIRDLEKTY